MTEAGDCVIWGQTSVDKHSVFTYTLVVERGHLSPWMCIKRGPNASYCLDEFLSQDDEEERKLLKLGGRGEVSESSCPTSKLGCELDRGGGRGSGPLDKGTGRLTGLPPRWWWSLQGSWGEVGLWPKGL